MKNKLEIYEIRKEKEYTFYQCVNCGEMGIEPFKECAICGLKRKRKSKTDYNLENEFFTKLWFLQYLWAFSFILYRWLNKKSGGVK